ncbi:HupE/UreJ family protein [Bacillus sp. UNC438CL73TsuS30]|uniref:HupE/UreJ family protein n=1 Tax=Bacillus sp. UNC438CL73TsuS30 TaxID=1340434 RepID=UPI001E3199A7|nr:HupE/UreJ family protein [Bacillus sp. UNC438CL73TsuS30]
MNVFPVKIRRGQTSTIYRFSLAIFLFGVFISSVYHPLTAQAHAYSASYTQITMDQNKTEVVFSIDTLSIMELIEGIDKNKDWVLQQSEIDQEKHHIEELLTEGIALDKDNKEQTPELEKMKIVKKSNKIFLSIYLKYPDFSPGETISFNDGFYANDPTTNYVNLISANYNGETSEAALQGDNRTWTMLLTEVQQEQQSDSGQSVQPDQNQQQQPPAPHVQTTTSTWFSFFKLGMMHILTGYDHLLFLLALLFRKQTFKQYAAIVTSFTLAHSITLTLSVLGVVTLPSRFVEAAIAFSICYVAAENIFRKEIRHRWTITFLFGLIHGLGFATLLREMAIPKKDLAVALVNFNLGIEAVQLSIVLLLLPLLTYMFKQKVSGKIVRYGSVAIVILGAIWLVQRLFL